MANVFSIRPTEIDDGYLVPRRRSVAASDGFRRSLDVGLRAGIVHSRSAWCAAKRGRFDDHTDSQKLVRLLFGPEAYLSAGRL